MCSFFSVITKGDGKALYFDAATRKTMHEAGDKTYDSHSSIATKFVTRLEIEKFNRLNEVGYNGACDCINKFEIVFNDERWQVKEDTINGFLGKDTELVEEWFHEFKNTKEFKSILTFHKKCEKEKKGIKPPLTRKSIERRLPDYLKGLLK